VDGGEDSFSLPDDEAISLSLFLPCGTCITPTVSPPIASFNKFSEKLYVGNQLMIGTKLIIVDKKAFGDVHGR
jgi:hypothetical protein